MTEIQLSDFPPMPPENQKPDATEREVMAIRRVAEFAARLAQAETTIAALRSLHVQYGLNCRNCDSRWPCATSRILNASTNH